MTTRYVVWDDVSGQFRPWSPDEVSAYPLAHVLDNKRRQHARALHTARYYREACGLSGVPYGDLAESSYWVTYAGTLRRQIAQLKALS